MDVCFKNVRNRHLLLVGELQVAVNVRTRIEHCSNTFGIVADQIGKLGDTVRLNAFKNECHKGSYFSCLATKSESHFPPPQGGAS